MATQQDIHAAGAENRPPMLEKGGYLPWTSRMLRYIKTKTDGKLMIKSIEQGPFKPRQVLDPGNPDTTPPTQPFYRDQTEEDYTTEDWKQIKADDMAMHLIQLGLATYLRQSTVVKQLMLCGNELEDSVMELKLDNKMLKTNF